MIFLAKTDNSWWFCTNKKSDLKKTTQNNGDDKLGKIEQNNVLL